MVRLAQAATATVRVVSDSAYVVGGANAGNERHSNQGLWKEVRARVAALAAASKRRAASVLASSADWASRSPLA